jgi:CDP-2,3-bis-(O-geranylgeranyl)-sn-glycerol synthase
MLNSLHFVQITMCVILLVVANGIPVVIADLFKNQWNRPVDGGHLFVDGRPWLGHSKTWRGILSALLATSLVAILLGLDWRLGILFASLAMLGDLLASFCKRRMGLEVSSRGWFLDQIPESLLPVLFIREAIGLSLVDAFIAVAIFTLLDLTLSPLLYKLHIRQRPY